MATIGFTTLIITVVILITAAFVASIVYRIYLRRRAKRNPGTVSPDRLRGANIALIVTSILFGTMVLFVLGVMGLMFMAVAFM